jgi:hypothetical protein
MPVNSLILPSRASLYSPLRSRRSHSSIAGRHMHLDEGAKAFDHLAHGPPGGGIGRDWRADGDAAVLGDLGRDIADALDVDVAVFLENPSSDDRCLRTTSPSSSVTGRPPISISLTISALAMVDLPLPESPVKNTVKPCLLRAGLVRRSSATTSGKRTSRGFPALRAGGGAVRCPRCRARLTLRAPRRQGSTAPFPAHRPSA